MGSYSDKLWAACQLIKEYNAQLASTPLPVEVKPSKAIDSEKFVEKIVLYGGVADELLRQCSWEDLEHCGVPRLLARKIAAIFRASDVPAELMLHSERAKKWLPLIKKWDKFQGISWRDYVGLVDRLEATREMCAGGIVWSGNDSMGKMSPESLTEAQVTSILEQIRDEYLKSSK